MIKKNYNYVQVFHHNNYDEYNEPFIITRTAINAVLSFSSEKKKWKRK